MKGRKVEENLEGTPNLSREEMLTVALWRDGNLVISKVAPFRFENGFLYSLKMIGRLRITNIN